MEHSGLKAEGPAIVTLIGEIDCCRLADLKRHVSFFQQVPCEAVILDLSGVPWCDSALIQFVMLLRRHTPTVYVVNPPRIFRKLLRITKLEGMVVFGPPLTQELATSPSALS